jgi:hypothetical protein
LSWCFGELRRFRVREFKVGKDLAGCLEDAAEIEEGWRPSAGSENREVCMKTLSVIELGALDLSTAGGEYQALDRACDEMNSVQGFHLSAQISHRCVGIDPARSSI